MDLIIVLAIGAIVAVTGGISPISKDNDVTEEVKVIETKEIKIPEPIPEPAKEPEPEPEPEPTPEPAKDPEPEPAPEPAKDPEPEEPKEEINKQQTQEQDAKPEEEETKLAQEVTAAENEEKGLSMLNIILYILGAIAVIAGGIYFFMRREPAENAADIARTKTSSEPTPEPQQEEPVQEETYSKPEPEQPTQEETQTKSTQEETPSENTDDQSSNSDDENNNR